MTQPTTVIPDTYDFNEHYQPLKVLNQGAAPTCWPHRAASHCSALRRMYDGQIIDYDPELPNGKTFLLGGFTNDEDGLGVTFHPAEGDMDLRNYSGGENPKYFADIQHPTPEEMRRAIYLNGVCQFTIASRGAWFGSVGWQRTSMPVVDVGADMYPADLDHDVLAVGFTLDGVIMLNSWSDPWGFHGRAVLSWAWIAYYGCFLEVDRYAPHDIDSVVMAPPHNNPPVPPPTTKDYTMLLIHKPGDRVVWAVTGGHLDRVPNPTDTSLLVKLGAKPPQEVPMDSPLWKLPVLH